MEDFFKFLLIAGVIIVGIVKEVNKSKKKKEKPLAPSMPPRTVTVPEAVPMPEAWRGLDELLQSIPSQRPTAPISPPPSKTKKKKEISVESSLANSAAQDKRNSQAGSHYDAPSQSADNETGDYAIQSAEDARRAIIWGEILQRKY